MRLTLHLPYAAQIPLWISAVASKSAANKTASDVGALLRKPGIFSTSRLASGLGVSQWQGITVITTGSGDPQALSPPMPASPSPPSPPGATGVPVLVPQALDQGRTAGIVIGSMCIIIFLVVAACVFIRHAPSSPSPSNTPRARSPSPSRWLAKAAFADSTLAARPLRCRARKSIPLRGPAPDTLRPTPLSA